MRKLSDIEFIKKYLSSKGVYVVSSDDDLVNVLAEYIKRDGLQYVKTLLRKAAVRAKVKINAGRG